MSFQIERGLFAQDFSDYHAVLGVPLDSESKDIRKQYLKIARALHPDSLTNSSDEEKQQATELLSKLVNPAYEKLSQERELKERLVILRMKGQQLVKQRDSINLQGDSAKALMQASDLDLAYKAGLQQLAEKQYQSLDQILEVTGEISELNLVYLLRKGGGDSSSQSGATSPSTTAAPRTTSPPASGGTTQPPVVDKKIPLVEQYCRRAEELITKQSYAQAILELRDGLKVDPNYSRCHSLLGMVYLRQNQATMAKIHFNQAVKLNPQDSLALEGLKKLEKLSPSGNKTTAQKSTQQSGKPDNKSGGGGLFGLFGGKKK